MRDATRRRYQVVAADGPASKAVLAAFALGGLSLLTGGLWLTLQLARGRRAAV